MAAPLTLGRPKDLGLPEELFPTWREHQDRAILEVASATQNHKDVFLTAPTGSGKSVIAVATSRILGKKAMILVGTKQLARQYAESLGDLGLVTVIQGRNNYPCIVHPGLTADLAPCSITEDSRGTCPEKLSGRCPYYKAKTQAMGADIVVANYTYALYELNYVGRLKRDMLILDEAHRTETELMQWIQITLNRKTLSKVGIHVPQLRGFSRWRTWAQATLNHAKGIFDRAVAEAEQNHWDRESTRQALAVKSAYLAIKRLSGIRDTWLEDDRGYQVIFKPVWVKDYAEDYLLQYGQQRILMSATPPYPKSLGISGQANVSVPSTFPAKSRQFIYRPTARMSYGKMDKELPKLAAEIDRILERHEGQKGVIHTVSYKVRDAILLYSKYPERMMHHSAKDRVEVYDAFRATDEPRVLLSPSMSEGVSFDEDYARFQIIAKVPFPDRSNDQTRARANEDGAWYTFTTCSNIVQTYGRIVRGPDDWGTTYCLDSNFGWLYSRNKAFFPDWFQEAVVYQK